MTNLNALIGSRICHDLINPLGAISNGIELLGLSGVPDSPEMSLLSESVENATARLRFLRLAFGAATSDQTVSKSDILQTLEAIARGGRLSYAWDADGDCKRTDARTAFLSIMCIESALPVGGDIRVSAKDGRWTVETRHDRLNLDPALWVPLSRNEVSETLAPAQVHFGLLTELTADTGRTLALAHGADWVRISF